MVQSEISDFFKSLEVLLDIGRNFFVRARRDVIREVERGRADLKPKVLILGISTLVSNLRSLHC